MTPEEAVNFLEQAFLDGKSIPPVEFGRLMELASHAKPVNYIPPAPRSDFGEWVAQKIKEDLSKQPGQIARLHRTEQEPFVKADDPTPPMSHEDLNRLWENEVR